MSLTRTSRRPCSASMRATRAADLRGIEVVDRDRDPLARRPRSRARRSPRSSPGRSTSERALAGAAPGRVDRRARLAEGDGDAAPARRGSPRPPARPCPASGALMRSPSRGGVDRALPAARCASSTSTAASTSAPPAICTAPSVSPKTTNASSTVTSGSTVARIDARRGADARRARRRRGSIAPTVETTARPASQPQPAAVSSPGRSSPSSAEPSVSDDRRAGADERRQHGRAHAPGDALADEDVGAVDDAPRRGPSAAPTGSSAPAPAPATTSARPPDASTSAAAAARSCARGRAPRPPRRRSPGTCRAERQQRRVDALQRGEEAAGLQRVADRRRAPRPMREVTRGRASRSSAARPRRRR